MIDTDEFNALMEGYVSKANESQTHKVKLDHLEEQFKKALLTSYIEKNLSKIIIPDSDSLNTEDPNLNTVFELNIWLI